MKLLKSIATLMTAVSVVFLAASSPNFGLAATMSAARMQAGHTFSVSLQGTIGKHEVEMYLLRSGEDLSGTYFYATVGTDIDISGKIDESNSFTLTESDENEKATGVFTGKLIEQKAGAETTYSIKGSWTKPDGSGALPFSLTEQRFDVGPGTKITSQKINKENAKPKYSVEIEYPQIEGSSSSGVKSFNQTIRSWATKQAADFSKDAASNDADSSPDDMGSDLSIGYEVSYASPTLISIIFSVSNYSAGAAHPNHFTATVNYSLAAGKELKLADLFRPGAAYLPVLSRYCIARLKKRLGPESDADWINKGAAPDANNYLSWNLTGKMLVVTFDPYQVAAYAAGDQVVRLRYSLLKDILRTDGPAAEVTK